MAAVQRVCAVICMAYISNVLSEPLPKSGFNYREFFPDTSHRINRRDGSGDVMTVPDGTWDAEKNYTMTHPERRGVGINRRDGSGDVMTVPDGTWDAEKNYTMTHPERRGVGIRQVGSDQTAPSTACITIRAIYDSNWVQSSGGNGPDQVRAVLAEAQNIFRTKYANSNQLGTAFTFNFEDPTYDTADTWQATGTHLDSSAIRKHVDTNSHTTDHYAFFGGEDSGGAIGIAYLGTTCERAPQNQRYKVSISEWYNNMADTAGVFAHELGHALGMDHDFTSSGGDRFDRNGVKCTDINGLMDYGSRSSVDRFSTCSKQDFRDFYNHVLQTYNNEFCLTCDDTNPPEPTGSPPESTENPPNSPEPTENTPEPTENPTEPPTSMCDGTDRSSIRRCCENNGPCNFGEGDCNKDSECASDLRCGRNNCRRDFSTDETFWRRGHDCCFIPDPSVCDGTDRSTIRRCCKTNGPCNEGQGDCNRDSECAGDLKCGRNNCERDFSTDETFWRRGHDCCFDESTAPPIVCDGTDRSTIRRCCRNNGPCNEGEGDCNRDSECAGDLKCGRNNCRNDFSTDATFWRRGHDCCISDSTAPASTEGPNPPEPTGGPATTPPIPTDGPNPPEPTDGPTPPEPTDGPATTNPPEPTDGPGPNPPSGTCGIKPAGIVGGSEVSPYSIPWQVALVSNGGNGPFCGGTLISPTHVLTASHCINSNPTSNSFDIIVGEHKTSGSGSQSDGTRHEICRAVRHPQYNSPSQLANDFAIVHLRQPVQIGTRATPACLPKSNFGGDFLAGKTMVVSGWGTTSSGGGQPNVLHSVSVPGITNSQCSAKYSGSQITSQMVCAGNLQNGGIDSCQGDSGGPMTYTEGGKATVVGVVSWGIGCAEANYPGVYARVTEGMDFINEELAKTC